MAEPLQMERRQGTYGAVTTFSFRKTITGSSIEDLSIHFRIVSPSYIDPTTIATYVGIAVVVVVVFSIVGFMIKKKR